MKKLVFVFYFLFSLNQLKAQENYALVIHGGAGTITRDNLNPEMEKAYREKLDEALEAGYAVLKDGRPALEAVVAAIQVMESSPLFNAGIGAVFTNEGKNELDASIMDGSNLKAGAVAGVSNIKSPIAAAKAVMEKSPHVILAGKGAEVFAKDMGLEIVDSTYFFTERRWESLQKAKEKERIELDHTKEEPKKSSSNYSVPEDYKFGTVGCVALDKDGNLAAGTSTGGMTNKKWNRIGDSPIIGAGTYANNKTCAVSSTGHGEYFIRSVVAYDISAMIEYKNYSLTVAANEVVMKKLKDLGGSGGVIAIDKSGNIAMPFNTEGMYRGFMKSSGEKQIAIYKQAN
jgi:beta-aspartyl-peptidase (threonine type)